VKFIAILVIALHLPASVSRGAGLAQPRQDTEQLTPDGDSKCEPGTFHHGYHRFVGELPQTTPGYALNKE
jgi:hypothetical protein